MIPPLLESQIKALIDAERNIPPQPELVRRRVLLRARAASRWQHRLVQGHSGVRDFLRAKARVAAFTSIGLLFTALCVAFGLADRKPLSLAEAAPDSPSPVQTLQSSLSFQDMCLLTAPAPDQGEAQEPPKSVATRRIARENIASELELLRAARQAIASGDYTQALHKIGAHVHLYPKSQLGEEREALRIRALQGLGRSDEANLAASAFRKQFPRNVLSRQMGETVSKSR